jgi:glycerol kinase
VRPKVSETTSLGAAYAAGLALGFWNDFESAACQLAKGQRMAAEMDRAAVIDLFCTWKKAVTRTFDWVE